MKRNGISLKAYKSLIPYLGRYKGRYFWGIACLITVDAAQIIIPQFVRRAVDLISSGVFEWRQIIFLSLGMAGVMTLVSIGRFLWRYFISGSSMRIEAELRANLFLHLQKMSWDFYQKYKIGDIMARSINDLNAVRMAIGMGLVAFFDFAFMATSILAIIFIQDARSAMFAVLPLPLVTALILLFGSMIGGKFQAVQEAYSKMSDIAQETFSGVRVVKSFVKEWWFNKKFADSNDEYRKANMELVRLFGFFFPFVSFLSGLTILIMLLAGGRKVIMGQMTPGSLVAMFSYLTMLIWPLMGAGFTVNMIQRGAASLSRVNEILDSAPSIQEKENPSVAEPDDMVPALELSNLKFSYFAASGLEDKGMEAARQQNSNNHQDPSQERKKKLALDRISLRVKRGEWLGIMGMTGSGKTTLVKTFTRMLDPPEGTVFVFGLDIREWPLESLRKLFAVSPQDSYLFSDTINNNVCYGGENLQSADHAVSAASLDRDISGFQQGKETLVGERGMTLSGGQKQRVAIARAVIMDSEFLILDDSFSAVDNETEQRILEALRKERKGRTTIFISHRVSTLRYADKVLVLENGKMSEYGSPAELASGSGFYSRMAAFQRLEPKRQSEEAYNG